MIILETREEALSLILEAIGIYDKINKEKTNSYSKCLDNEVFLTRLETARFLKITLPTLNQYTKQGIVVGQRFGSRILYLKQDLIDGGKIINLKNKK